MIVNGYENRQFLKKCALKEFEFISEVSVTRNFQVPFLVRGNQEGKTVYYDSRSFGV